MNKNLISVAVICLFVGYGASYFISPKFPVPQENKPRELIGQVVLAQQETDGSTKETGLRVPYDLGMPVPWVVVSPDKKRVIYAIWSFSKYHLYVADVDGGNARKLADQFAPEGSGGLNVDSIHWSLDGTRITYEESGPALCKKTACLNPGDLISTLVTNSVDVQTGEKKVISTQELN